MPWRRRAAAVVVAVLVAGTLSGAPATARDTTQLRVAPVLHARGFADPSVVPYSHGYLALSTGWRTPREVSTSPRGRWHQVAPALPRLPHWVRSREIWAADVVKAPGRGWLLYYAALARGHTRCIGVATARHVTDAFRPIGRLPVACPPQGAIDPSGFTTRAGLRYLVYKTQGNPSEIRLLRLTADGRHRRPGAVANVLLTSRSTVENPVLVQRHHHLVLFTSEGYYGSCDYRTTWRRSTHLFHWEQARSHVLLGRQLPVCGPGGADLIDAHQRHSVMYFHGWACDLGRDPCPPYFRLDRGLRPGARRELYAARLRWRHGTPHLQSFMRRR